jgi:hypothetical protein
LDGTGTQRALARGDDAGIVVAPRHAEARIRGVASQVDAEHGTGIRGVPPQLAGEDGPGIGGVPAQFDAEDGPGIRSVARQLAATDGLGVSGGPAQLGVEDSSRIPSVPPQIDGENRTAGDVVLQRPIGLSRAAAVVPRARLEPLAKQLADPESRTGVAVMDGPLRDFAPARSGHVAAAAGYPVLPELVWVRPLGSVYSGAQQPDGGTQASGAASRGDAAVWQRALAVHAAFRPGDSALESLDAASGALARGVGAGLGLASGAHWQSGDISLGDSARRWQTGDLSLPAAADTASLRPRQSGGVEPSGTAWRQSGGERHHTASDATRVMQRQSGGDWERGASDASSFVQRESGGDWQYGALDAPSVVQRQSGGKWQDSALDAPSFVQRQSGGKWQDSGSDASSSVRRQSGRESQHGASDGTRLAQRHGAEPPASEALGQRTTVGLAPLAVQRNVVSAPTSPAVVQRRTGLAGAVVHEQHAHGDGGQRRGEARDLDYQRLAVLVYRQLKQRLLVERERAGMGRTWRG